MAKQTLFAYVDGTENSDVAAAVEQRLDALVANRRWVSKDVWVVNQHEPPNWDLGINVALGAARSRPKTWADDVVAIAQELAGLHKETGKKFVIGIHDDASNATTDLFVIENEKPDLEKLREALKR